MTEFNIEPKVDDRIMIKQYITVFKLQVPLKKILKNSGFYDVEYQDGEAIESEFHVIFRCYYYSDLEEKESEDDENQRSK